MGVGPKLGLGLGPKLRTELVLHPTLSNYVFKEIFIATKHKDAKRSDAKSALWPRGDESIGLGPI